MSVTVTLRERGSNAFPGASLPLYLKPCDIVVINDLRRRALSLSLCALASCIYGVRAALECFFQLYLA